MLFRMLSSLCFIHVWTVGVFCLLSFSLSFSSVTVSLTSTGGSNLVSGVGFVFSFCGNVSWLGTEVFLADSMSGTDIFLWLLLFCLGAHEDLLLDLWLAFLEYWGFFVEDCVRILECLLDDSNSWESGARDVLLDPVPGTSIKAWEVFRSRHAFDDLLDPAPFSETTILLQDSLFTNSGCWWTSRQEDCLLERSATDSTFDPEGLLDEVPWEKKKNFATFLSWCV